MNSKVYKLDHLFIKTPSVQAFKIPDESQFSDVVNEFVAEEKKFTRLMNMLQEYEDAWRTLTGENTPNYYDVLKCAFYYMQDLLDEHTDFLLAFKPLAGSESSDDARSQQKATKTILNIFEQNYQHLNRFLDYSENLLRVDDLLGRVVNDNDFQGVMITIDHEVQKNNPDVPKQNTFRNLLALPVTRIYQYAAFVTYLSDHVHRARPRNEELCARCDGCLERLLGYVQCVDQIYIDTIQLRELEQIQNKVANLSDPITRNDDDVRTFGYRRTDLHQFGRLLKYGFINIGDGSHSTENIPHRFVILMEELILVCYVPQQASDRPHQPYHFKFRLEILSVDINQVDQHELRVTLHGLANWKELICMTGRAQDIASWTRAFQELRDYHILRQTASKMGHTFRTMSVPIGSKCDYCKKMFSGSYQQAFRCVNDGRRDGCSRMYHRDCVLLNLQECTMDRPFPRPSRALQPWNAGDTRVEEVATILPLLVEGTYAIHGLEDVEDNEGNMWLSITMSKWEGGRRVEEMIAVQHRLYQDGSGRYVITSLPLGQGGQVYETRFRNLEDILEAFEDNRSVNLGTENNPYFSRLKHPWWEAVRRRQRKNGCLYYDWIHPEINIATLMDLGLVDLQFIF